LICDQVENSRLLGVESGLSSSSGLMDIESRDMMVPLPRMMEGRGEGAASSKGEGAESLSLSMNWLRILRLL